MFSTTFEIIQFVIGILGAITTITCFIPQGIKTFITKDTSGLSKWFFISAIVSSIFWLTIGAMTISSPYVLGIENVAFVSALSSGLPPIITNVITIMINVTILVIKLNNIYKSKQLNMSEAEYCLSINKNKCSNL